MLKWRNARHTPSYQSHAIPGTGFFPPFNVLADARIHIRRAEQLNSRECLFSRRGESLCTLDDIFRSVGARIANEVQWIPGREWSDSFHPDIIERHLP